MSNVIGFGPRDENEATYGANESSVLLLFNVVAVGFLSKRTKTIVNFI